MYVLKGDSFHLEKVWNKTSHIKTREDVRTFHKDWENLLEEVLLDINQFILNGSLVPSSLSQSLSLSAIPTIINRNELIVSEELRKAACYDSIMEARIDSWQLNVQQEYKTDGSDKYRAYAKSVLLNWTNRILFAHLIKNRQNIALRIDELNYHSSPTDANSIFADITSKRDFFHIFSPMRYDEILPFFTWRDLVNFSLFLKENGLIGIDQTVLQDVLEETVSTSKRVLNGVYSTPKELARILVEITLVNHAENALDCCCGSGTIVKALLDYKREYLPINKAVETVWASDKNTLPLQIANMSLVSADSINLANRIFQHNALTLEVGEKTKIVDPITGKPVCLSIPSFGTVVSNLPFVSFNNLSDDDKELLNNFSKFNLDRRSDLYCYIAISICNLLKEKGRAGLIVSNSWMGTKTGNLFISSLQDYFHIRQVHISGKGRWFSNAQVVATILILEKKTAIDISNEKTLFFLWKRSLKELASNKRDERLLIDSSLLGEELTSNVVTISSYTRKDIEKLVDSGLSYNSLFHSVEWCLDCSDRIVQLKELFDIFRGSRRGWDPLFFPKENNSIESCFLKKCLKNAKQVEYLDTEATDDAFCCNKSIEELRQGKYIGALEWIERFSQQHNEVVIPLSEVLKKKDLFWYELQDIQLADFFTMMNPERRFFFARLEKPAFINQRLIGLKRKSHIVYDMDLCFALLNSVFTLFCIEAAGFGRALGALDVNSGHVANYWMFDPRTVGTEDREQIVSDFAKIRKRKIMSLSEELNQEDRRRFEETVFSVFGMKNRFEVVRNSLLSMQRTRLSVKEQ